MPYIKEERRSPAVVEPWTEGELNYAITKLVDDWIWRRWAGGPNYIALSAAVAALECAKLEFYRRAAAPYEDKKCAENGDVYRKAEK